MVEIKILELPERENKFWEACCTCSFFLGNRHVTQHFHHCFHIKLTFLGILFWFSLSHHLTVDSLWIEKKKKNKKEKKRSHLWLKVLWMDLGMFLYLFIRFKFIYVESIYLFIILIFEAIYCCCCSYVCLSIVGIKFNLFYLIL